VTLLPPRRWKSFDVGFSRHVHGVALGTGVGTTKWHPERMAVALFGAAFLVVGLFLAQSLLTLRTHERVVDATLKDFAAFAADGIVAELNSTFAAIFLDHISVSRAAHYAWASGDAQAAEVTRGRQRLPGGAVPAHFSLVDGEVITRGGEVDADTEAWLIERVGTHARDVYPRPAPYAVLQSPGPQGNRVVVYRREEAYEGVAVFGFLFDFTKVGSVYPSVLEDAPMLPQSMSVDFDAADLLAVHLALPPYDRVLYTTRGPSNADFVRAEAFAAKAGRISVQVDLDAALARPMVSGALTQQIPLFTALAVLTLLLFLGALIVMRRAARLSQMREIFVENVSHDLRTPLAQIRMFSETLLLERLESPEERRRSLEIIRQQASHLSDLVENILHASTRNQAALQTTPTLLSEVLDNTLEALEPAAKAKRSDLEGHVSGLAEAAVDPGALRRILMNLVDNALKYGPEGQTVRVELEHTDGQVEVIVADQGPGVPRVERSRVWERFQRLERDDGSVTGAGIGLSVVRQLAEQHGGTVRLSERTGGGAQVHVTLATEPVR
jgi:signal transduction histidine kinase